MLFPVSRSKTFTFVTTQLFFCLVLASSICRADEPLLVSSQSVNSVRPAADTKKPHPTFPRLAADFEPQRALVLSVSDWQPHHAPVFRQLIEKTRGHVEVLVLCNGRKQLDMVVDWLKTISDRCDHLYFADLELDTIWLRDFAPLHAQTATGSQSLDFYYVGERPKDDRMPKTWAQRTGSQLIEVHWTLQGGNLISNGQHLAIATERIFVDNAITFPNPLPGTDPRLEGRKIVFEAFVKSCNLEQFIILEHLQSEATKHIDMFANFVGPDRMVVARVDPRLDPINAAILDRNARRLQTIKVGGQPLQIHRVQIPARDGQSWSAFANIIIANDLVLMPTYETDPPALVAAAVALYQKLLPKHQIKTVDITSFKQLQGELHCLSMNLPKFAALPSQTIRYTDVIKHLGDKYNNTTK